MGGVNSKARVSGGEDWAVRMKGMKGENNGKGRNRLREEVKVRRMRNGEVEEGEEMNAEGGGRGLQREWWREG